MFSTVSDNKYDELKNVFGKLSLSQAFVVTAFALERLWQPFVEGISDCAYTEQERQEVLQLERQILDIIWTHILFEDTQVDHWQEFCKLYDQIEEVSAEVDLNFIEINGVTALYFLYIRSLLQGLYNCCIKVPVFKEFQHKRQAA